MRQVPGYDGPPVGIVGDGRVARHFRHYLTLLGVPIRTWCRRDPAAPPPDALAPCRVVLVLIRDDAIDGFVESWPALREKRLVHFSGSLTLPGVEAAHPLMTFGHTLYALPDYVTIPFIVEVGGSPFPELLPGLPNPWFAIPRTDRPYYHALCVMAGNFSTLLWTKLFVELEGRFGIPASAARPYLARVAANLAADPNCALSGPLSRGDTGAIASNLRALRGDAFHGVYEAFVRAYDTRA
jgi:predicted short-subunit dehydrogenase-like oxidoreductase (DUF2520 family)